MSDRRPPPPRKGKRLKPATRHWSVKADIGAGPQRVWFEVDGHTVVVRAWHGRRRWSLPLDLAAQVIARRAQARAAELHLGTSREDR